MRIIDWSSDVCSSDLRLDHHVEGGQPFGGGVGFHPQARSAECAHLVRFTLRAEERQLAGSQPLRIPISESRALSNSRRLVIPSAQRAIRRPPLASPAPKRDALALKLRNAHAVAPRAPAECGGQHPRRADRARSEEHTSELQSLMRISYAV